MSIMVESKSKVSYTIWIEFFPAICSLFIEVFIYVNNKNCGGKQEVDENPFYNTLFIV